MADTVAPSKKLAIAGVHDMQRMIRERHLSQAIDKGNDVTAVIGLLRDPAPPAPPPPPPPVEEPPPAVEKPWRVMRGIGAYHENLQGHPGAIKEVELAGRKALEMTVLNTDGYPHTPTVNPRAQLGTEPLIKDGQTFYWSGAFFLPSSGFPATVPGWGLNIVEMFADPYTGSPPWQIQAHGASLLWSRNQTYHYDVQWAAPLSAFRDRWVSYVVGMKWAKAGWVEMWIDGTKVVDHLEMETRDASSNQKDGRPIIQAYFQHNVMEKVVIAHADEVKLGDSFDSVK